MLTLNFELYFDNLSVVLSLIMGERRRTINIRCGKKLSGKSWDEILDVILAKFQHVEAVQQSLDVVRVTFREEG